MLFSDWLPGGGTVFGAAVAATMGAALLTTIPVPNSALAASCPSVSDPQGIKTTMPYQLDLADYEAQIGRKLTISENPLFADQVSSGALPPVAERIPPEDALVYLPYEIGRAHV